MQNSQAAQIPMTGATQSPMTGASKVRPRSGRTPLLPKNSPATPLPDPLTNSKSKQERIGIAVVIGDSDKENHYPAKVEQLPLDASLAEELTAIKKKLERLRLDREKTERMLEERNSVLDAQMKEMDLRGQFQKCLEIEVDRLFRLKEINSRCMRISPIKSLREKEQVKILNESPPEVKTEEMMESEEEYLREEEQVKIVNESPSEVKTEEPMESEEESGLQSPGSASSEVDTQKI